MSDFVSWGKFFVGKYDIQSTNEIALKRTVTSREFSFSRCTHAHAKCPPVYFYSINPQRR